MTGRRIEHEAIAVRASRRRRLERGGPPATFVLDAWRQKRRINRVAQLSATERRELLG